MIKPFVASINALKKLEVEFLASLFFFGVEFAKILSIKGYTSTVTHINEDDIQYI
jgi:hypothetical protein